MSQAILFTLDGPVEVPELSITLPGGLQIETQLEHLEATNQRRLRNKNPRTFIGSLKGDKESVISVTGCLDLHKIQFSNDTLKGIIPRKRRKMQFTMFSSSTNSTKFVVDERGKMYEIEPDGLTDIHIEDKVIPGYRLFNQHEMEREVPDDLIKDTNFPKRLYINIAYGYDKSVKEYFSKLYSPKEANTKAEEWIEDIHTHMQSYYKLNTLKTKINFNVCVVKILMTKSN